MLDPKPASRSVKITPLKAFKDAVISGKRGARPRRRRHKKKAAAKKAPAREEVDGEEERRPRRPRRRRPPPRRRTARDDHASPVAPISPSKRAADRGPSAGACHAATPSNTRSTSSPIPTRTTSTLATLAGSSTANSPIAASTDRPEDPRALRLHAGRTIVRGGLPTDTPRSPVGHRAANPRPGVAHRRPPGRETLRSR